MSAISGPTSSGATSDLPATLPTSPTSSGTTATPAPSAASGTGYAFGSRQTAYAAGTRLSPNNAAMDTVLASQYDAWKARRAVNASAIVAGGYAIQFSDTNYMAVSEGMGYGMLIAVVFAGHDPNAQQLFDGLLSVVRTRYAYGNAQFDAQGKYLMDWRINADGSSGGGGWNAVDGDLDVAMALLMADRQWGSAGKWNYLQEAKNTIGAIKSICMVGDGTTKGLRLANVSRTSDYMIGHFRAFARATGDSFWNTAVDRAVYLSNLMQTVYSPGVGLMPDFIVNTDTATPIPSPGFMGDGNANENKFWWNACRNPWRFASDYVLSGDARVKTITQRFVDFFQKSSGGDPVAIGTGYNLDGSMVTGGQSPAYHGPICAGACIDARYQGFADTLWTWNAKNLTTGYYDSEIQLLSMVVASGNWWTT
ncbi:MAG TPA: glycosyl hydrolase family 8 [Ramlibacter sp.]|nr:glycosyl hydrolase family 8 [Ramlibacter sp.]